MIVMMGDTLQNKISHDLFTVREFADSNIVMLESQNGYSRMWLPEADLESFFEKIDQGGNVK